MGLCRSCKHWGNNIYEHATPNHWPGAQPGWRAKFCEIIREEIGVYDSDGSRPTEQTSLPIATPPGFGCNQFEVR